MSRALIVTALLLVPLMAATAMAQETPAAETHGAPQASTATGPVSYVFPPGRPTMALGITIGLGLIVMGAGRGIGSIGSHATDAIARQPEAGGRIFTTMIISAALIEGVTLFAIVLALLTMILGTV